LGLKIVCELSIQIHLLIANNRVSSIITAVIKCVEVNIKSGIRCLKRKIKEKEKGMESKIL